MRAQNGIEAVNTELKEVRVMAGHEMVLSEESEGDKVVAYLTQLKESVDRLQAEAARINKYQVRALCDVFVVLQHKKRVRVFV